MAEHRMLKHMREVLDEHTLPLEDMSAGLVEAVWLIYMINEVEKVYRNDSK